MKTLALERAGIILGIMLLATLPFWVGNAYYINVASQILLFAVLALALNILVGYGGLVSLGHAGLFAIAGYTAALMLENGYGHLAADLSALAMVLVAAAVFGVLALRTTGIGFLYNFGQAMFPDLAYVILFLPMLAILVLRPQGLFGKVVP